MAQHPPPPVDPTPERTWQTLNGSSDSNSTYLFAEFALPWVAAKRVCEGKGAFLAEIESQEENLEIIEKAKELKVAGKGKLQIKCYGEG